MHWHSTLTPEEGLWRTVVCQAVRDAATPDHLVSDRADCGQLASITERRKARVFIFGSEYAKHLCSLASVDLVHLRCVTERLIESQRLFSMRGVYLAVWGENAEWLSARFDDEE